MTPHNQTLYKRVGGNDAVEANVDTFLIKVLSDKRIKHFFAGIDMKSQYNHQKDYLTYAFGGPPRYRGKAMREAHKHLVDKQDMNESHLMTMKEHLNDTLIGAGMNDNLIAEVMTVVQSIHDDVLGIK